MSILMMGLVVMGLGNGSVQEQKEKLPVPSMEAQHTSQMEIRTIFKEEYGKKDRTSKSVLAKKLFDQARDISNTADSRYALLLEAQLVAEDAFDYKIATDALDQLYTLYKLPAPVLTGATFTVDINSHKMKLLNALRKKTTDPSDLNALCSIYLSLAEEAHQNRQYDDALTFVGQVSKTSKDGDLTLLAKRLAQDVNASRSDADKVKKFEETLKVSSEDPLANEVVGIYECFVKGDWEKGLPKISKSTNPLLHGVAQDELLKPSKAEFQIQVGEEWLKVGEKEKNAENRRHYQERAAYWFQQALKNATGLEKAKVENKMKEIASKAGEPDPKGLLAYWKFNEGKGTVIEDCSGNKNDLNMHEGASWAVVGSSRVVRFDGLSGYAKVKNAESFPLDKTQTIAWFQYALETRSSGQVVMAVANTVTFSSLGFRMDDKKFIICKQGGREILTTEAPTTNKWNHIAYVYDEKEHKLYINGILKATSSIEPNTGTPTRLEFGRWGQTDFDSKPRDFYSGFIKEVHVYNRVLDEKEIRMLGILR